MNKTSKKWTIILLLSIAGMALRLTGLSFEGVDYKASLLPWFLGFQQYPGLTGLAHFEGDYNIPYVTILCLLSHLPIAPIVSIKMSSILFDYLEAFLLATMVSEGVTKQQKDNYYLWTYALVLLNPIAIINSGYLAQCESVWVVPALFSFRLLQKDHPILGMLMFGFSFAMKPQGVFILPLLLIYYFAKKTFSGFHFLWTFVGIELLCVPAIIGGCPPDVFIRFLKMMMGHYPYVYYYYPNFWVFLENAPYYVFGKVAIFSTALVLAFFAIAYIGSKRKHSVSDYLEYIAFTSMTCAMVLPCMHERYNYLAELILPVCAIFKPKYRPAALILMLVSLQCNAASYLGWPFVSHYLLAAINIAIYIYLGYTCISGLLSEKDWGLSQQ